jgi:Zn-dependent peptidase ImmA (M78 family)
MHELGHLVLHGASTEVMTYAPSTKDRPVVEREADAFMQMCLVPRPVLFLAISRVAGTWEISLREALGTANTTRGRWQWRNRFFTPLINVLGVSRQMLCIKLQQLKIFSFATARYHLTYVLDNRWMHQSAPLRSAVSRAVDDAARRSTMT